MDRDGWWRLFFQTGLPELMAVLSEGERKEQESADLLLQPKERD